MVQINRDSGKERKIRQPMKWKSPSKPLVPPGPTTVVTVPPGSAGTTIQVPHPRRKGEFISVNVPASAKPGQAMLVPVPSEAVVAAIDTPTPTKGGSGGGPTHKSASAGGWSTADKVALGAAVGGAAVGG